MKLTFPRRGLFHFSGKEYRANAHACLTSDARKVKTLTHKRGEGDNVTINLYGYPVGPMP